MVGGLMVGRMMRRETSRGGLFQREGSMGSDDDTAGR